MLRSSAALFLFLSAAPASAGKVELCVDDACTSKVTQQKLDCKIHRDSGLTFGFKFSIAFVLSVGPEVGRRSDMNWDAMQKNLIRQYEEICDMHNKGAISVAEFNKRYDKINAFFDQAKDLKKQIVAFKDAYDEVRDKADKEFDDLDKEDRKRSGLPPKEKVAETLTKVDQLAADVKELDDQAKKQRGKSADAPQP